MSNISTILRGHQRRGLGVFQWSIKRSSDHLFLFVQYEVLITLIIMHTTRVHAMLIYFPCSEAPTKCMKARYPVLLGDKQGFYPECDYHGNYDSMQCWEGDYLIVNIFLLITCMLHIITCVFFIDTFFS